MTVIACARLGCRIELRQSLQWGGALWTRLVVVALALLLAGCRFYHFDTTATGQLTGQVVVIWVKPDRFVYVPHPTDPLTFRPSRGPAIVPDLMYTDGGSIPRIVQAAPGFSPWGYAPAYIIHDWLFTLRDCDPAALARLQVDFDRSSEILAEVIKALVANGVVLRNDNAFSAISWAVSTPIARQAWDMPACRRVSPDHRRIALATIGRGPDADVRTAMRRSARRDGLAAEAAEPSPRGMVVYWGSFGRR